MDHGGGVYSKGGGKGPRVRGGNVGPGTFGCGRLGMLFFGFRFLQRRMGCGKKNKHKKQGQSTSGTYLCYHASQHPLGVGVGAEMYLVCRLSGSISDAGLMSCVRRACLFFSKGGALGHICPFASLGNVKLCLVVDCC